MTDVATTKVQQKLKETLMEVRNRVSSTKAKVQQVNRAIKQVEHMSFMAGVMKGLGGKTKVTKKQNILDLLDKDMNKIGCVNGVLELKENGKVEFREGETGGLHKHEYRDKI
jgi:hypothetical protein